MTSDEFLDRYPEFDRAENLAHVELVLAEVALELVDEDFGDLYDEAHGALTGHRLWASPFGVSLRQEGEDTTTSKYLSDYNRIVSSCEAGAAGVTGGTPRGW
jgi:hypothetical protein